MKEKLKLRQFYKLIDKMGYVAIAKNMDCSPATVRVWKHKKAVPYKRLEKLNALIKAEVV